MNGNKTKRENISENGHNTVIEKYSTTTMGNRLTEIIYEAQKAEDKKN